MSKKISKPKIGQVYEVSLGDGWGYIQYAGKSSDYGDMVKVIARKFTAQPEELASLQKEAFYFTFFPLGIAAKQGLINVSQVPGTLQIGSLPQRWRRAGKREPDGKVSTWIIEDGSGVHVKTRISTEERNIPIASIWNLDFLIERIRTQWQPKQDY